MEILMNIGPLNFDGDRSSIMKRRAMNLTYGSGCNGVVIKSAYRASGGAFRSSSNILRTCSWLAVGIRSSSLMRAVQYSGGKRVHLECEDLPEFDERPAGLFEASLSRLGPSSGCPRNRRASSFPIWAIMTPMI